MFKVKRLTNSGGRHTIHRPGVMNKLEASYASHLEVLKVGGEILDFAFEPVKLRLAVNTTYSPDFMLIMANESIEMHEVKGTTKGKPFCEDHSKVKIKVAADSFPFKFVMVWKFDGAWQKLVF